MLEILVQVVVVIACITIHEFSHGYAALLLGDDTAKRAGRLTLNPMRHLDIIGAIMLLVAHIGWAKPVPVNPYNFKDMKVGMALTGAAGPASNFLFAILAAMLFKVLPLSPMLAYTLQMTVMINIALGLFNLIPIPPLDGSRIIGAFMNDNMYFRWLQIERKAMVVMIIVFAASFAFKIPIIGILIMPPLRFFMQLLLG